MRIQHNIAALNSYRQLNSNNSAVSKNLEKLSSGYKINRAGDDAAGLAISEKMRAQITGLETAQKNAQDGISLVQTAEGNLQEVHSMLNRMVELATQSANGTYDNDVDRANLQKEVSSLKSEINRISESANYNGINLLDGSLAKNDAAKINFDTVSTTKGMTLETGANGKGAKGEFTIDLSNGLFGTGDTLQIDGKDTSNTTIAGGALLTYGNEIKGSTAEEQAQSIAEAMNRNVAFAQHFDIKAEGSKVTFISKEEGATKSSITGATVTDSIASATGNEAQAAVSNPGMTDASWQGLFGTGSAGSTSGFNVEVGDMVEFNFTDVSGKVLTAKVEITSDMFEGPNTLDNLTQKVVDKLKDTHFVDIDGSAADESLIKVSDMFDLTANKETAAGTTINGSILVKTKPGGAGGDVGDVNILRDDVNVGNRTGTNGTPGTGTTATAQKYEITASTTGNLSDGDTFTFSGTLSDGRNFSIDLVAGRDFAIDNTNGTAADYAQTAKNLINALNSGTGLDGRDIKVTVGTGNNAQQVNSNTIFGATADLDHKLEFTALADATGKITLTSTKATTAGKGGAGAISNVNLTTVSNADATLSKTKGVDQGYASSKIKLDNDLQYGSALKIGDKTFEFVKDARDVTSRNNIAVVVDDIENASAADIAKKLTDAAKANGFVDKVDVLNPATGNLDDTLVQAEKANGSVGIISFSGNEVTITGMEKGSTAKAPKLSTLYGDKVNVAEMKFDPSKLNYGDQFSINGKTYEFVANEDDASEGSIGVVVEDMKNASAKDVATALADVAQGVKTSVGEDGTITIQSMADADGNIAKPSIVFEGKGLSLQVGDTNKDYQRVNVKIGSMSAESLAIDDVNIGSQEGAAAAIDKVKAAINKVSSTRGDLGAIQNRLEHTINNLGVTTENMTAAESRIRDTDMAKEMMEFTKNNILVQASQAMLAQANQLPQGVLQLLQ